jgi:hypothetical protein
MTITNKQAELDELEAKFKALKTATEKKHAGLNAELSARQTEVQNITQIKEVCPSFLFLDPTRCCFPCQLVIAPHPALPIYLRKMQCLRNLHSYNAFFVCENPVALYCRSNWTKSRCWTRQFRAWK